MSIKVGINGFGRIGRLVFRAGISRSDIEFVGINDPFMTPDYMAYMLRYDTMHGQFDGTIEYTDDAIIVNGKTVKFFACMDPKDIPWGQGGRRVCSGVHRHVPDQGEGPGPHRRRRQEGGHVRPLQGRYPPCSSWASTTRPMTPA